MAGGLSLTDTLFRALTRSCRSKTTLIARCAWLEGVFVDLPSFMMTRNSSPGPTSLMFSSGLPSTSSRSARLPPRRRRACRDRGCAGRRGRAARRSSTSPSSAPRRRVPAGQVGELAPCRFANAGENRMSVPNAVLIPYFPPACRPLSVPATTCYLRLLRGPGRDGARAVVEERLGAQPDALVGHQPGRCLVHQMPVLDALHAGRDRTAGSTPAYRRARRRRCPSSRRPRPRRAARPR